MDSLTRVRRVTARRRAVEQEWRDAIRAAVRDGKSVRAVAEAADVTHPRVVQLTRDA